MRKVDILIIGGGPAGLSAGIEAYKQGVKNILIIERNKILGGILNQCIHNGFGLHYFKEELTGPEYADKLIKEARVLDIPIALETMVLNLTKDKIVTVLSENGIEDIEAKTVILAMGCRERPRGAINIPGERCAGVFSAGTAQEMVNLKGLKVGKEAVILGSGDIGLIMARRLTFEGTKVKCVVELMPYSSGLKRNIVQCLDDFGIPLKYNSTIIDIVGKDRVEGVYIAKVDESKIPIIGTEEFISCDTILLSVGLLPENELSKTADVELFSLTGGPIVNSNLHTNIDGIFACGNVLHVHDLVDNVSLEGEQAARSAVKYLKTNSLKKGEIPVTLKEGVRYIIPHTVCDDIKSSDETLELKFRSDNVYAKSTVNVYINGHKVKSKKYRIITPGEMEIFKLTPDLLKEQDTIKTIEIGIEV
ncbi:MAG: NAD(P)/FAD-dependent oxidoreductase [Defluviitaleaceae bacterium]|nr:NAD(P)/FAD-dependent oxidoreductase [Defluviitaleaceae bacterium]